MIDGNKYNDGNVHIDFFDKSKEELDGIADEFSEGNTNLKNTLLTLWNSGIQTMACCVGHEDRYPGGIANINYKTGKFNACSG